jgi:hypothetical protein
MKLRSSQTSRCLSASSSSSSSSMTGSNYLPTYNGEHRRQKQSKHHQHRNHSYSHNKSIQYTDDLDTDSNSLKINVMKDLKSAQKLKSNLKNSSNLSYSGTLPLNYKNKSLNSNNINEIKSNYTITQAETLSTSFKGTKPKKFCLKKKFI